MILKIFTLLSISISFIYYGGLYQDEKSLLLGYFLICLLIFLYLIQKLNFNLIIIIFILVSSITIFGSPNPECDCFTLSQEATIFFLEGKNPYDSKFTQVYPNVEPNFYFHLPFTFIYNIPFLLIFGDVRWGVVFAFLLIVFFLKKHFELRKTNLPLEYPLLVLFSPRSFYIIEHMYAEVIIFLFLWLALFYAFWKKKILSAIFLALGLLIKINIWLILPFYYLFAKKKIKLDRVFIFTFASVIVIFILPFYFWNQERFIKNIFFFVPWISNTLGSAPVKASLGFFGFLNMLNVPYSKFLSSFFFFPLYFYLLFVYWKKRENIFLMLSKVLLTLHFFLFYSFFNHYYLIILMLIWSIIFDDFS